MTSKNSVASLPADQQYIELNLSNYDMADVEQLNAWGIWAHGEIERLQHDLSRATANHTADLGEIEQLRAAIVWVTRDAAYKAPEQINAEMVDRWMSHLLAAVGFDSETSKPLSEHQK